ncbi:MAG: TetR/AcrR family transcriptional regulator [Chlorobi bacterium]|nr:TetR/AcrR family transcriptional regulator [Chlorobiota bacterium]
MKPLNIYDNWINYGYRHFAEVGPLAFSIKEISKQAGMSRTSFNYYFNSKAEFIEVLLAKHLNIVDEYGKKFRDKLPHSYINLLNNIDNYPVSVTFHLQLFNYRYIKQYNDAYIKGHELNFKNGILDWFIDFFGLKHSRQEAEKVYYFLMDTMYSRANLLREESRDISTIKYSEVFKDTLKDFLLVIKPGAVGI